MEYWHQNIIQLFRLLKISHVAIKMFDELTNFHQIIQMDVICEKKMKFGYISTNLSDFLRPLLGFLYNMQISILFSETLSG